MGVAIPPEVSSIPMQFGFTLDNVRNVAANEAYIGPRQAGAGFKVTLNKQLMLYGDAVESFSNSAGAVPSYYGAAEISVADELYVRGGLFGFTNKGWSAGGGWVGPRMGISYGYQNQHQAAYRSANHAVTVEIYM